MKCNYPAGCFKIKKSTFFLFLIVILVFAGSPGVLAQSYWMQKAGSATDDEGYSISTDDSNNTYTTGYFTGTAAFGATSLTAAGVSDIFVTKTNSSGIYKWAVKAGDGGSDRGLAIKTDAKGNSYITGYYYGTATFGTHSITSAGVQNIFVAKYDRNGNVKWVVSAGGTQSAIGNAITVDNSGNIIITGQFAGAANFGTYALTSISNNTNVFTAKLDSANGSFMWAKSGVGAHTDRGLGVASDPSGNVYITGQFTDTITFDNVHRSTFYDAIFVVKYNSAGVEQWITTVGGGTLSIANAIAVDNSSNVYITGNFAGTINFIGSSITTLAGAYPNCIFLAKYDQNANLLWNVQDGSSSPVTSNDIALDASGNPYIIGNFECIMSSYAKQYGQGTFNTVGSWDIFTAEYIASNGAWQWSRQIGGHGNNYGYALAISSSANICTAGSFDQDQIIPVNPFNFLGYNTTLTSNCNSTYCSDPNYGSFESFSSTGELDIFIAQPINLNRQPYDYYVRTGSSCSRPQVGICVGTSSTVCLDTVQFCGSGSINAISKTCTAIAPDYSYLWSTGATGVSITVSKAGWYYVTQTSADGCYTSKDSIYVVIHPIPSAPCLSDNLGINTNSTNPDTIRVCERSVVLTGCNYSGNSSWYWTTPNGVKKDSVKITVNISADSGSYCFNVVNKYGCINQTCVWVAIDSALPHIIPKLECSTCKHDTAFLCKGNGFTMFPYDSISNPSANQNLCIPPSAGTTNKWYLNPNTAGYGSQSTCPDQNSFTPYDSGWYHITDTVVQSNVCGKKKYVVKDSVYVRLYPLPVVNLSIKGNSSACPGDSEWIVASGNTSFTWSTGSTKDSIYVGPGFYYAVTPTITNAYGCSASGFAFISISSYTIPPSTLSMNPSGGVVCPGDSVELICSGGTYQKYQWYSPSGILSSHTSIVYVKAPGSYYCNVSDSTPCTLSNLSNTVVVELYATPYLQVSSSNICPGDSVILSVVASNNAIIKWLAPLSGSSATQIIKTAGTYSVQITSCGITTQVSITITASHPFATISVSPSKTICDAGDSIYLSAASGMTSYVWEPGSINSQNIYVKTSATYTLTATDAFGCSATSAVIISPPLKDSIASTIELCKGFNNGTITVGVSGGASPYTYSWLPHGGNGPVATNLAAGTYTITVTDANGCTKTTSATLTESAALYTDILSSSNVNCYGDLNGIATATTSGGQTPYTYTWSPGGQTTTTATGLSAGTYTVTISDPAGCNGTASVIITQHSKIVPTLTIIDANCFSAYGSISVSVSGGVSPYTYLWSPGRSTNTSITGLTTGTYSLTITDSIGCTDTTSVKMVRDTTLNLVISGFRSVCSGQNDTLTVSGATTYLWSSGSTSTSIIVTNPTVTTDIWVKGTSGICTDSVPYQISIYNPIATMPLKDSICPGMPVVLKVNVRGGKSPYSYIWNNGINADSPGPFTLYPTTSTTYSVNITDACNNKVSDSMHVKVFPKGTTSFLPLSPDTIRALQTVTFTNTSQNMITYFWTFGDGGSSTEKNPTYEYLNPGIYQIILYGYTANGCPDSAIENVDVLPGIYIPNVFTPNGDGINDVFYFTIQGALCFHCDIYNRWGVLIYELNSTAEGWNGIVSQTNEPASAGVYDYIINYCDYKDVSHQLEGYITLIRSK